MLNAILVFTGGSGREEQGGEVPPCMQGRRPEDAVWAFRCLCSRGAESTRAWIEEHIAGLTWAAAQLGYSSGSCYSVFRWWSGSCAVLVQRCMCWENVLVLQGRAQVQLALPQGQREVQESRRH
eukprot:4074084-Pleurochrysis_carterae.AAC.1